MIRAEKYMRNCWHTVEISVYKNTTQMSSSVKHKPFCIEYCDTFSSQSLFGNHVDKSGVAICPNYGGNRNIKMSLCHWGKRTHSSSRSIIHPVYIGTVSHSDYVPLMTQSNAQCIIFWHICSPVMRTWIFIWLIIELIRSDTNISYLSFYSYHNKSGSVSCCLRQYHVFKFISLKICNYHKTLLIHFYFCFTFSVA